jgi:hypothetical protein
VGAAALAGGAEPFPDLLGNVAAGEVPGERAGGADRARGRSAVRDHDAAAEPEQRRAAVALGVEALAQLAEPAALQQRAEPPGPGSREGGAQFGRREPHRSFERLQRHVAGEPVGDDHVDRAGHQVAALDVAREVERQRAALRFGGEQLMRPAGQHVPLARLGADGEQPHLRRRDAERYLRVGHAELAELNQHLRLWVGGGADVDEHRVVRVRRQHDGESRPRHAGQLGEPVPGARHDRAGRPGRDDRGRLPAPDQLARDGDAGPGTAEPGERALAHVHDVLGGHDSQFRARAEPGDHRAKPGRRPGEQRGDAVFPLGGERAGHDLVWGVVAAHRVHGDHRLRWPGGGRLLDGRPGRVARVRRRRRVLGVTAARRHMAHVFPGPSLSLDLLRLDLLRPRINGLPGHYPSPPSSYPVIARPYPVGAVEIPAALRPDPTPSSHHVRPFPRQICPVYPTEGSLDDIGNVTSESGQRRHKTGRLRPKPSESTAADWPPGSRK